MMHQKQAEMTKHVILSADARGMSCLEGIITYWLVWQPESAQIHCWQT